jgi:hypothetical protein
MGTNGTSGNSGTSGVSIPITSQIMLSSAGCLQSTTNGATGPSIYETSTNKENFLFADFAQSVDSYVEWTLILPSNIAATPNFKFKVFWTANTTSTNNVVWQVDGVSYANGETLDAARTGATMVDAHAGTAYYLNISDEMSTTFNGSPSAGEMIQLRCGRIGTDGRDNFATTARLLYVSLVYDTSSQ